jgi:hypothetical protein
MSPYQLEQYLESVTGRTVQVIENVDDYTFGIIITGGDDDAPMSLESLCSHIRRHKPSHMAYDLTMQAQTGITISVETAYWRFFYGFSGTIPEINYTAGLEGREIRAQPEGSSFSYPYLPCGVFNTGGEIQQ